MKLFSLLLAASMIVLSAYQCSNKNVSGTQKLRGRLVIKEICAHYVVEVIGGSADSSLVTNGWRDEKRNKTYNRVFTVSNRCSFPAAELKEGDEFEFSFDKNPPPEDCLVCMAYYEVPAKRNAIKVLRN